MKIFHGFLLTVPDEWGVESYLMESPDRIWNEYNVKFV